MALRMEPIAFGCFLRYSMVMPMSLRDMDRSMCSHASAELRMPPMKVWSSSLASFVRLCSRSGIATCVRSVTSNLRFLVGTTLFLTACRRFLKCP